MTRTNIVFMVFGLALGGCGGNSDHSGSSAGSSAGNAGGTGATAGTTASGGAASGGAGAATSGGALGGGAGGGASAGAPGSSGSGAGGAAAQANPPYYGSVQFGWLGTASATFQTLVDAQFTNPTVAAGLSCTEQTVGACTISTCTGMDSVPAPQAGVIALSDGNQFNVSLTPSADGTYTTYSSPGILLPGDQTITVTAEGGDIPAFSGTVDQPLVLLVTAPPGASSGTFTWARTQDLPLTFQRGMPGIDLIVQGGSSSIGLSCVFPSEAGTAVVPTAALAMLSADETLYVLTSARKRVQAGSYSVDLIAFGTATNLAKTAGVQVLLQ